MNKKVIFVCETCEAFNRMNYAKPDFNRRWTTFNSFTDAFQHLMDNRNDEDHEIVAKTEDDET